MHATCTVIVSPKQCKIDSIVSGASDRNGHWDKIELNGKLTYCRTHHQIGNWWANLVDVEQLQQVDTPMVCCTTKVPHVQEFLPFESTDNAYLCSSISECPPSSVFYLMRVIPEPFTVYPYGGAKASTYQIPTDKFSNIWVKWRQNNSLHSKPIGPSNRHLLDLIWVGSCRWPQ